MGSPAEKIKNQDSTNVLPLAKIPMGLSVKGLIMEKIQGTTTKGDLTYHIAVAVKGLEKQLKIKVSEEIFNNLTEMTPYANSVVFSEFNGRIYWQESDL